MTAFHIGSLLNSPLSSPWKGRERCLGMRTCWRASVVKATDSISVFSLPPCHDMVTKIRELWHTFKANSPQILLNLGDKGGWLPGIKLPSGGSQSPQDSEVFLCRLGSCSIGETTKGEASFVLDVKLCLKPKPRSCGKCSESKTETFFLFLEAAGLQRGNWCSKPPCPSGRRLWICAS